MLDFVFFNPVEKQLATNAKLGGGVNHANVFRAHRDER